MRHIVYKLLRASTDVASYGWTFDKADLLKEAADTIQKMDMTRPYMSEKIEDTVSRLGGNICGVVVKTEDWLAAVTDYGYAWFDEQKFKTAENNTIDYDAIHDVLCKVWSHELSADEGLDIIESIVE